jgi:signal transduction histidine kinase
VLDLAAFSRSDAESLGPMDLRPVLESAINMAWHEIRSRARLMKEYGDVPLVDAHETQLGQVFYNLILNAALSIAPGAADRNEIRVVTRTDAAGNMVVEIRDTGAGITEDERIHLFDPFFTTNPAGSGTGVGLAVCHGIVSAHEGTIVVESELGKGTVVRVVLPPASARSNITDTQTFE